MQKITATAALSLIIAFYGAAAAASPVNNKLTDLPAFPLPVYAQGDAGAVAAVVPAKQCSYSFAQDNPENSSLNAPGRIAVHIGGVNVASYGEVVTWREFIERPVGLASALTSLCDSLRGARLARQ